MSKQLKLSSHFGQLLGYIWGSPLRLRVFVMLVLSGIVVGLYVNSLENAFVNWDDPGLILGNKQIRSLDWSNIKEIFSLRRASTYQPIRVLSYAVDYHFWKLNPLGYHITNIVFYLLTCLMIFFATCELLKFLRTERTLESNMRVAFFATLLFAVHPVHVEAVAWLSARKEVLLGFFFFSSLYCYLRAAGALEKTIRAGFYGLAFLCFVLAAFSKPSAVVLPGIILTFEFSRGRMELARLFRKALWFIPPLLFSFVVIFILLKVVSEAGGIYPYWGGGLLSNMFVASYLFILNIKLVALTVNYCNVYIFTPPYSVLGLFVLLNAGFMALAVFMRKRSRVIFFAIFWFYITLVPFSNIIPISSLLADRYVFIPSFAYCLVLALGLERLWSVERKDLSKDFFPCLTIALLVALLSGYSYMTVCQNRVWRNSYTLWADAAAKQGENSVSGTSLGAVYLEGEMDQRAFEILKRSVELNPYEPLAHNNLGIAYQRLGEYEKSEHHYLRALSLKPDYYGAHVNLGMLFAIKGDFERAIDILTALLAEHPQVSNLHFRLGYVYEKAGKLEEAIKEYEKSIELTPHIINPYESLARLYLEKLDDPERALYFFKKGIEMAPNSRRVKQIEAMIKRLSDEQVSSKEYRLHPE